MKERQRLVERILLSKIFMNDKHTHARTHTELFSNEKKSFEEMKREK